MDMTGDVPPLTLGVAFGTWQWNAGVDVISLLAAVGYLHRAWRTLPRQGIRWSIRRTISFLAALVVAVVTLQSSIETYSHVLFSIHMIQHLLLIMVVPTLFILGQPIRLAQTGNDRVAQRCAKVLRGITASVVTFPLFGLGCYAIVLVGTHLSGFMQSMMTHMWLHQIEVVLYVLSGYLYFLPLLGHEPIRRTLSYPLRVFLLLMGMTVDTVIGLMLMMTTQEPFPAYAAVNRMWGPSPLSDIHTGGGIMWVIGDALMFAVIVLVVAQWMGDTERQNDTGKWLEAARRSALADRGVNTDDSLSEASIDNDDDALDAYNRMLARLSQKDESQAV